MALTSLRVIDPCHCLCRSKKAGEPPAIQTYFAFIVRLVQMFGFLCSDKFGAPWPTSIAQLLVVTNGTNFRG